MFFLGNMSNPNINRWGQNQFWQKLWYTDKNYSANLHCDKIFIELLKTYFLYGILFPKNIFYNHFWYLNKHFNPKIYNFYHNTKYYRIVTYKNLSMNVDSTYNIRTLLKNVYFTKIYIFRYQSWLILNLYCYQPRINKRSKKKLSRRRFNFFYFSHSKQLSFLYRTKLALFYLFFNDVSRKNYYIF